MPCIINYRCTKRHKWWKPSILSDTFNANIFVFLYLFYVCGCPVFFWNANETTFFFNFTRLFISNVEKRKRKVLCKNVASAMDQLMYWPKIWIFLFLKTCTYLLPLILAYLSSSRSKLFKHSSNWSQSFQRMLICEASMSNISILKETITFTSFSFYCPTRCQQELNSIDPITSKHD